MATPTTYEVPTVSIDMNDAAFLGAILGTYIYQNKMENNQHLVDLLNRITPKAGC
jgi:hypothetical protein